MYSFILVVHIILAVCIVCLVLMQRSEGSSLGGLGGGNSAANFMTGRAFANALSKTTAILAGLFVVTTLTLGIMAKQQNVSKIDLNTPAPVVAAVEAPAAPVEAPAEVPAEVPAEAPAEVPVAE